MATATVHEAPLWGEYSVSRSRMGAYCDFLALTPDRYGRDRAVVASFLGPDTAVRGILAVASEGREDISFRTDDGTEDHCGDQVVQVAVHGQRQRMVKLGEGITHGIASAHTDFRDLEEGKSEIVVMALDGDLSSAVWRVLWDATALPLASEWAGALPAILAREGALRIATIHRAESFAHPDAQVATLNVDPTRLGAILSEAVRTGELTIPRPSIPYDSESIPGQLDDYLVEHGPAILRYLGQALPARHSAEDEDDPRIEALTRSPFPAQGLVMQGLAKAIAAEGAVILSGEMGVGKTLMMAGVAYLRHQGPFRALVICPPHLVRKWAREVEGTIPGSRVEIVRSFSELVRLRRLMGTKPVGPEFYVMARSRMARSASLAFGGVPARLRGELAVEFGTAFMAYRCPDCGEFLVTTTEDEGGDASLQVWTAAFVRTIRKSNERCPSCKAILWAPDVDANANREAFLKRAQGHVPSDKRYFRPYQFVKKHLGGLFDTLIVDEVHEYKGDTNRGSAMGTLAAGCGEVLMGTGTILGGYASHLAYILFRTNASKLIAAGFNFGEVQAWIERYGTVEKVYRLSDDRGKTGKASTANKAEVHERPGVSPSVFADFLLPMMATISLEDLRLALPEFDEDVIPVEMTPELKAAYRQTIEPLEAYIKNNRFGHEDPGFRYQPALNVLNRLYPDQPFASAYKPVLSHLDPSVVITTPVGLPESVVYPKELVLVEEVKGQVDQGRRVLVYIEDTVTRDITGRLQRILTDAIPGLNVMLLPASVNPEKREDWFEKAVGRGVQVVIVHPGLVETGLDLIDFPTIVFYQTTFNLFRMRQASRRSWRIGQPLPVRVRHIYYKDTYQEKAITLMGRKLYASLALEGRFGGSALLEMAEAEVQDGTKLAKQLAGSLKGEDVWDRLRAKRTAVEGSMAQEPPAVPTAPPTLRVLPALTVGLPMGRRGSDQAGAAEQLSLFG
ncbi:MAG: helicase-related protein [Candidatus Dormibacteria bacterium]